MNPALLFQLKTHYFLYVYVTVPVRVPIAYVLQRPRGVAKRMCVCLSVRFDLCLSA